MNSGPTGWPRPRPPASAPGRSVLAMVPDQRDVERSGQRRAAVRRGRRGRTVGRARTAARYRRWLAVLRGDARLVIGTRSAVFAPVHNLGLVIVWDDGDDTLAEPRAPYPHAREVAMLRAHQLRCAAVIGGYARTAEAQALVRSGWAHDLVATRQVVRPARPGWSRWMTVATPRSVTRPRVPRGCRRWRCAPRGRHWSERRPVLVQVPRRGYVPSLACNRCRTHRAVPALHRAAVADG